ncbi:MAG: hypothetical protein KAW89_10380 [Armatimonadetes bacterium]|nr:hypothetical protein [Armatimonadota bacterium]
MNELSQNIRRVALVAVWSFLLMALVFGYWQVVRAPALRAHPYNQQAQQRAKSIKPGLIYTGDGELVMGVEKDDKGWQHTYPAGPVYCHLTGYNENTGLQKGLREALLGIGAHQDRWGVVGYTEQGLDVVLTTDSKAQRRATKLMEGRRGAVVALDPRSGAILALVSSPSYDPARVLQSQMNYEMFTNHPASPELNRALQGLYPPGTILQIFVAATGLDTGVATEQTVFNCSGSEQIAGITVNCSKPGGHGRLTLSRALADSCNIAFAELAQLIGPEQFRGYLNKFHLLDESDLPLPTAQSKMADLAGDDAETELVEAALGQRAALVTPIAMARLAATIASGGQVIQPYLVDRITRQGGETVTDYRRGRLGAAISQETAQQVAGMMQLSVEDGSASSVGLSGCRVAAKTGSAQNPEGRPHSWALGFAPVGAPQAAVAVIVENSVPGRPVAGPIAREILEVLVSCQ